jgi:ribosomal subunit interface protein
LFASELVTLEGKGVQMNVIVHSKTMVITEAIRSFVVRQSRKLIQRGRKVGQVVVFLENIQRKKNDVTSATAKFLIDLPGKNVVVQERAQDLYLAINNAAHRAGRQLGKVKERRLKRAAGLRYV